MPSFPNEAACTDEALRPELHRYVTDSEMYAFATQAMIHRENTSWRAPEP